MFSNEKLFQANSDAIDAECITLKFVMKGKKYSLHNLLKD